MSSSNVKAHVASRSSKCGDRKKGYEIQKLKNHPGFVVRQKLWYQRLTTRSHSEEIVAWPSFLLSKLSSNLVSLCRHDKVIAVKPLNFVCPLDNRDLAILGQDCRVMSLFFCECADFVGKGKRLHKVLQVVDSFQTWNLAMFNNAPFWDLGLQLGNLFIGYAR